MADNSYYRRVYAFDKLNNTGSRSNTSLFKVDTTQAVIIFTGTTPANNAWISGNIFTIQQDITELNLSQFTRNRNGSGYALYDSGLVFMMNFDNISNLGEVSGSIAKDVSLYNAIGSIYG